MVSNEVAPSANIDRKLRDEELAAVRPFNTQRRLDASRLISGFFGFVLTGLVLAFLILAYQNAFGVITQLNILAIAGGLLLCVLLYGIGWLFAQNGRLLPATIITVVSSNLSIIAATLSWTILLAHGLTPVTLILFAATTVPILLAGELSDTWAVFSSVLTMNVLVLGLIVFTPSQDPALTQFFQHQRVLFTLLTIAIQWAVAAIAVTMNRNYLSTMRALGQAYVQVQRLDGLKDQFITNINHELRTPVMTLQAYIEYLRLTREEIPEEEIAEMLDRASRSGMNLVALLTSILDVRRIDEHAGEFELEPVVLLEAIEQSLSLLDPREVGQGARQLHLSVPHALRVMGEPVRVQQIMINLISNAIKYSDAGMPIEISARVMPKHEARQRLRRGADHSDQPLVEIRVRDYGLGIPPDQIPLLFNRFVRLPRDLASTVIGNGLGLYLCRVLSRAMGGDIRVVSQGIPGEGSTFYLTLLAVTSDEINHAGDITNPRMKVISVAGKPH